MADQTALKHAFSDYARTIARRYDIGDVLYRLTDQSVSVLRVDGAGVSIGDRDDGLAFVTATDDRTTVAEQQQVAAGAGPCHDAFRSGDHVTVADLTAEERWPDYTPVAIDQGLRAVAGIPMSVEDRRIGVLTVYSRTPREWPADELEDAQLLADMATGYVLNAEVISAQEHLAQQLQHALESRIVIEQAKGVLAAHHGIDPSTAFQRLRHYARTNNETIHGVAHAVVERRLAL